MQASRKSGYFENRAQKLRELRNDVKRKVDVAERQQMKRLDQVQGWLSRVEDMETEVTQLIGDGAENIEEKRFVVAAIPSIASPATRWERKCCCGGNTIGTTVGLESTFDRVWRCLGEEHVGMIGLYGLGGVGKTTLLTQINNHFLKTSHNFDVVIWVVVSKTPNLDEVQNEIWEKVGFCDDKWKSKSRHLKAKDIWKALNEKRFVML
ncbi:putative disease resistance protein [Vitis vinifera]|uniref:Putative disease resistance protein n=1 Tax=Vitis vinifera TaxID=29760 RepID=A0A438D5U8_VITVI|nr:putative disease resistance protein [Vitis vinifera]